MAECGIYLIENKLSPLFYIGQSHDIYSRWRSHKSNLNLNNGKANARVQKSWSRHGAECFQFQIIELCAVENLTAREEYWLSIYKENFPNRVANAEGPVDNPIRGGRHSDEVRGKISAALKGRAHSDDRREKMSRAAMGHIKSAEACLAISAGKTGKPNTHWQRVGNPSQSSEWRARFSGDGNPARRPEVRKKMSDNNGSRRAVVDAESGEVWETMSACAAYLGVSVAAVHAAATKKNPRVAGRVINRWFNAKLHQMAQAAAAAMAR